MIIDIAPLRKRPRRLREIVPVVDLDLGDDPFVRPGASVACDLRAECVGEELLLRGTLAMDMECLCARCGAWFRHHLVVSDFTRAFNLDAGTTVIDLTQDIREDIMLAFPSNWICRTDCRGVCSGCGANLNGGVCACDRRRPDAGPDAWAALGAISPSPAATHINDKNMEEHSHGNAKTQKVKK